MYKAIVADDEDIIRNGIIGFLKQDGSIEVVADASDGVQALDQAKKLLPDIIYVDINMPNMNGLELIEKLNDLDKEILVIVITGYSDFKYAQKALRLGVFDYFLKPIMEDPFFKTLQKAKAYMDEQKVLNKIYDQLKETSEYAVERCLNQLSLGLISEENCINKLEVLNLEISDDLELLIISPGGRNKYELQKSDIENEDIEIPYYIKKELEKFLDGEGFVIIFVNIYDHVVCLAPNHPKQSLDDFKESLELSVDIHCVKNLSFNKLPEEYLSSLKMIRARIRYSQQVQLFLNFIRDNYSNSKLTLSMISNASNASPGHLNRLCKDELHRTVIDYLSHYRIKMASSLLLDKNLLIYEIAEQVGFTSQHYFCNAFKKITGQPPKEYRRSLEGK